jgi:DNA-binding response OmpR family regulator
MTNILIYDERPDTPDFLLETIVNRGYKASYAKNCAEIIEMLSNDKHDVILANGGYRELNYSQYMQLKSSSVFIIGINDPYNRNKDLDMEADFYLPRPVLISELWQAMEKQF